MQHELKRRDAVAAPTTAQEFYQLSEIISAMMDQVAPYDSMDEPRGTAQEVFDEFQLRCRVVEAIGAFLRTKWVTEELRGPYERILVANETEIEELQKLAEQRWISLELQSAIGNLPETKQ